MHNSQSFLATSTKSLSWINWDLTVSSDSQLYLIRSLIKGVDSYLAPYQNSHKNFFQLERTCSLLHSSSFWLHVWASNTSSATRSWFLDYDMPKEISLNCFKICKKNSLNFPIFLCNILIGFGPLFSFLNCRIFRAYGCLVPWTPCTPCRA